MTGLLGPDGQPLVDELVRGPQQRVDAEQLDKIDGRWAREVEYATKSQTHLWVAILTHKVSDAALDGLTSTGEAILFDTESLLGRPQIGCLICERPYSERLRSRTCRGVRKDGQVR